MGEHKRRLDQDRKAAVLEEFRALPPDATLYEPLAGMLAQLGVFLLDASRTLHASGADLTALATSEDDEQRRTVAVAAASVDCAILQLGKLNEICQKLRDRAALAVATDERTNLHYMAVMMAAVEKGWTALSPDGRGA